MALGALGILLGMAIPSFVAAVFVIPGAVFVAVGILGFMLRAALTYWETESRAQASALYDAITDRVPVQ